MSPSPSPLTRTLPALLTHAAERAAPGHGVTALGQSLAWSELRTRATALARGLVQAGVQPGDRVALYLEPSLELVVGLFGVACAGAVAVPIHGKLRDAQVQHVVRDAQAAAMVVSADKLAFLRDPRATLSGARLIVAGEVAAPTDALSYAALLGTQAGSLPQVAPNDLGVILYTSGSTGLPKGIVQDHHNLVHGAEIVSGYLGLRSDDHILGVLPLSFDYGLNQLLDAAWLGASLTLQPYFTAADLAQAVTKTRATVLAGVPSLWAALSDALRRGVVASDALASLRVLTNSGGRLYERDSATLRERLPHAKVFAMYGLTEAFRSSFLPPDELPHRPTSIGKAIPGVELWVVDERGQECPPGVPGELVHAGALVSRGYWRNPEATARVFRPHPLDPGRGLAVFSGDLVRRDEQGFLYWVARRDAQLKVAGHRVSPDEVEMVLNRVPGVKLAVLFGKADETRADTTLVAHVVPSAPRETAGTALLDAVRAACKRELPAYMVPAEIVLVDHIPLTPNGKPDRVALAAGAR